MSYLGEFMRRAFPDATVRRLDHKDAYLVSLEVDARDLKMVNAGSFDALRKMREGLTPRVVVRRRLHWGNANPRRGMLRLVMRTGSFGHGSPSGTLAAP